MGYKYSCVANRCVMGEYIVQNCKQEFGWTCVYLDDDFGYVCNPN